MDALDRFATALGVEPVTRPEVARLLTLARDVAHGTERRNAPLATFLVGLAVAGADDRAGAIEAAAAVIGTEIDAVASEDG